MSTRSCADCRFWNSNGEGPRVPRLEDNGDDEDVEVPHRRCLRALHANRKSMPERVFLGAPMLLLDGSGYAASLYTLPTFSCSGFEA